MTSQDTGGVRLPDGRAAASVCRRGAAPVTVVAYSVVWMQCTRVGCYWRRVECTLGRWGLRAVGTTLGQWIPTLVEQADSRQSRRRVIASRPSAQAASRGRWGRTCDGGAGPCRKDPGLTPARPGVHSADINGLGVSAPSRDRWNPAVSLGCAAPIRGSMSALWTPLSSRPIPSAPSPPGPPACPGFPPE